ncbi:mpv17-like protein 2 [Anticarsia gemmatalis]|uniref:mpv17-like protein 2 n=1 Tax=Anticarsia gemmatalis TaxID=129554 RepID=UPI003F773E24
MFRRNFAKVIKSYQKAVDKAFCPKNLFYTNLLISMGISTLGDLIEQTNEYYKKDIDNYDFHRTAHMAFSGVTAGFICHHWYNYLDTVIVGRSLGMVFKKLMMDQFICSPIVILSFFATVAIFEDNPAENFTDEVKDKFWTLYKAEWVVWPPAQIINFYFLPTRYRVVYDNTISLGYDIYTSQVKHDKSNKSKEQTKEDKSTV